jgi:L-asparaginase II
MRSCAKPFQCYGVVESGAADAYGFTAEEIAVIAGSHPGEPVHVAAVASILKKARINRDLLQCGVHPPSGMKGLRELHRAGKEPTVLHNNCSGKHSGMVATAKFMELPLEGYLKPSHPLQKANLRNLARFAGVDVRGIAPGVDGCSAPTFALPLRAMARAMAAFVEEPGTARRVCDAMMAHPSMVGRPCVNLMSSAPGRIVTKGGAEGVHISGFPGRAAGIALKVVDGNARAWVHVIHAVVRKLGWLEKEDLERLRGVADPRLKNHAGKEVGEIRVIV